MRDWSTFTRKIYIHEKPETLFELWATPNGLMTWFLKKAEFKNPKGQDKASDQVVNDGDTYIWGWHNWDKYEAHGEIVESNGKDHLVFSFEKSLVSVDIYASNGKSLVSLTQYNIPTDDESKMKLYVGCSNGWTFWLANLKSFCENGLLINDKSGEVADGMVWVNM